MFRKPNLICLEIQSLVVYFLMLVTMMWGTNYVVTILICWFGMLAFLGCLVPRHPKVRTGHHFRNKIHCRQHAFSLSRYYTRNFLLNKPVQYGLSFHDFSSLSGNLLLLSCTMIQFSLSVIRGRLFLC